MSATLLYSALTRIRSISTSKRAELLSDEGLLLNLREGRGVSGLDSSLRSALEKLDWEKAEEEDREILKDGVSIIGWSDTVYPESLRNLPDPPPALYLLGNQKLLSRPSVAMVGSRMSTVYGQNVARTLAQDLSRAGLVIVSGLARGIDTHSHEGALMAGGYTLAVLGTGIDRIYPSENKKLSKRISVEQGAVISEYPPGTPPLARNFPVRNRIIAGLSLGVLVVEATERSGSLITARLALESGKDVYAVPHNITNGTGTGPNTLIKGGAKLVQRAEDVLEELPETVRDQLDVIGSEVSQNVENGITENAERLLEALKPDEGLTVDELCMETGLSPREVLPVALELQMAGMCVELPGARYARSRLTKEK